MISDDEIRAALHHVVSRAPDPAAVRTQLADRARRHRQRRVLLTAGGAAGVVAAVGVPGALLWQARTGYLPFLGPGPDDVQIEPDTRTAPNLPSTTAEPAAAAGNLRIPLRYRPTWMLDGYVEAVREVGVDGPVYQNCEWQPRVTNHEGSPFVRIMLAPESLFPIGDWRRPVMVNGVPAALSPKVGQFPQVIWAVGDGLNLSVSVLGVGDDSRVAQWVARSIVAGGQAGVETPVRIGWVPDSLAGGSTRVSLSRDGDAWLATAQLDIANIEQVHATLGPAVVPYGADGAPAQLWDRPGLLATFSAGGGWAYVELADGLRLSVVAVPRQGPGVVDPASPDAPIVGRPIGTVTPADLVRIVEGLAIGSVPYVGWLGQRQGP